MKILTYNVNGIRAFFRNGKWDALVSDYPADVYCFQETKAGYDDIRKLVPDDYYVINAENHWKKGYAGVATIISKKFYKDLVSLSVPQLGEEYNEGRVVTLEFKDFYLVNVYTLNSGDKDEIRKEWDKLFLSYIKTLNKPVVIVGDLNVCSTELDYWGNYAKAINTAPGLMQFEIDGFNELVTECNLDDVYRNKNGDIRKYSWYSTRNKKSLESNQGWRLDYVLVSSSFINKIDYCDILEKYQGPDHSPIIFYVNN